MAPDTDHFNIISKIPIEKLPLIKSLASEVEIQPNEVVFQEGDPADHCYIILDGNVELSILHQDQKVEFSLKHEEYVRKEVKTVEKNVVVDCLGSGDCFGWTALVEPHLSTATATSVLRTKALKIAGKDFLPVLEKDPELGFSVNQAICEIVYSRLSHRTKKLIEVWVDNYDYDNIAETG